MLILGVLVVVAALYAQTLELLSDLFNIVITLLKIYLGLGFSSNGGVLGFAKARSLSLIPRQLIPEGLYFGSQETVVNLQRLNCLLQRQLFLALRRILAGN